MTHTSTTKVADVTDGKWRTGALYCTVTDVSYSDERPFILMDMEYSNEDVNWGSDRGFKEFFHYVLENEILMDSKAITVDYYGPYEVASLSCAAVSARAAVDYMYGIPSWYVKYLDSSGEEVIIPLDGEPYRYAFPGDAHEDEVMDAVRDEGWEVWQGTH